MRTVFELCFHFMFGFIVLEYEWCHWLVFFVGIVNCRELYNGNVAAFPMTLIYIII